MKNIRHSDVHLSDDELMLCADGEAAGGQESDIREHLSRCWSCRLRMRELEDAVADFTRLHQTLPVNNLPPAEGPRALLKARLREVAAQQAAGCSPAWFHDVKVVPGLVSLAAILSLMAVIWLTRMPNERYSI